MIPKDCKRLAEVGSPMPKSSSRRRGRSTAEDSGRGTNRVIAKCRKHEAAPLLPSLASRKAPMHHWRRG